MSLLQFDWLISCIFIFLSQFLFFFFFELNSLSLNVKRYGVTASVDVLTCQHVFVGLLYMQDEKLPPTHPTTHRHLAASGVFT